MKKRLCSFLLSMVLLLGLLPTAALASETPSTKDANEVFRDYADYYSIEWFNYAPAFPLKDDWKWSPDKQDWYSSPFPVTNPTEGTNEIRVYAKHGNESSYHEVIITYNYDVTDPNVEVIDQNHDEFPAGWPTNRVKLALSDPAGSWNPSIATSGVKMDAILVEDQSETRYPVYYEGDIPYFVTSKSGKYKICLEDNAGNFVARDVSVNVIPVSAPAPDPAPKPTVSLPAVKPVTVPVSGEENTVHLSARITGQSAKLEAVNAEEVAHVSEGLLPAPLTMDLSAVNRPITEVKLPTESLELIAGAAESGNVTGLEIKLPGAALTFDKAALQNIAYAAEDAREITLLTKKTTPNKLSTAQQETLAAMPTAMIWEISLLVGKEPLHYFGSGTVRVELPYESASPYLTVRHLAEDGSTEPLPTRHARNTLSFTTPHFSHFILTEDETNYRHLCPNAYSDIHPKQWHHAGVDYVVENGIMGGYSDGSFRPAASTTRAQIATMLWRLSGKPVVNYLMTFRDVKAEQYYTEAVRWAASEGIMGGYDSNYFGTHDPVTREQLAAILWRFAKYAGKDVSVGEDTNILSYNDVFDMSEYAIPAMQWACGSGVIMGKDVSGGGMVLLPKNNATRGEIAVMLMRFAEGMR